ncbi:hypothetical protein H6G68_24085 [Anabaena catenula FACHB-362]|uniref:Uncharacterized protein n=1 Tax=Anabaena catenula FACHB-362 TaxID=2692877 RepID=A0ABR8J8S4_9NOST|nr:hypothetical protein [Anabaena catenula FACHB-362]
MVIFRWFVGDESCICQNQYIILITEKFSLRPLRLCGMANATLRER